MWRPFDYPLRISFDGLVMGYEELMEQSMHILNTSWLICSEDWWALRETRNRVELAH